MNAVKMLLIASGERCEICEKAVEMSLLHNRHPRTGKRRGHICSKCASILYYSDNQTKTLENAIKYIEFYTTTE